MPTISNSASSSPSLKSPSHVHKIRINGSQILPSLSGGDNSHHYHTGESHSSNFHQQLAAHQRRMNSLDRLNIINGSPHGQRSHSLNMNPYNSLPHGNVNNGNQQSVIYSHDATMPTFSTVSTSAMDDTKMSVIKSIKARQDMFLSKHMKMNPQEEVTNQAILIFWSTLKIDFFVWYRRKKIDINIILKTQKKLSNRKRTSSTYSSKTLIICF